MIRTSAFDAVVAEVQLARSLGAQLARVRAAGSATLLASLPGGHGTPSLNLEMPAAMIEAGLLEQLRQAAARLAMQGLHFDEAERAGDIPPPPKRIRRKKDAAA